MSNPAFRSPAARAIRQGLVEGRDGVRIFRAGVDVTLGRADREGGDRHALDQAERVALQQHAVGVGAGVALIGVADDVFLRSPSARGDGLPLDAGGEPGAAATAQAGRENGFDRRGRSDRPRAFARPAMPPWAR